MEAPEFKEMVESIRNTELALGCFNDVSENDKNRRRLLFLFKDIKESEIFTKEKVHL